MTWIKITHVAGSTYLNFDQVYRYETTSSTDIAIYDASSLSPTSYTFTTNLELTQFIAKLKSILKVIDIDQLATQG